MGDTPRTPDEEIIGAERPAVASTQSEDDRLMRVRRELVDGFESLHSLGPAVSVWGSARVPEGDPDYELRERSAGASARRAWRSSPAADPG